MLLLIAKIIYLIKISYITSQANYNFLNCDWFKRLFPTNFTIKVNVKKQRRLDRSTVIFKLKSKNFCMRLNIQSIIKMLMRY